MADNTSIPIIVQGNSFSLAIPLQIYVIDDNEMVLEDYTPDPTDEVSVQLKGSRRNYTYTPTIDGNVANIDLTGNELADNYGVVVSIVKADGQRLRSFRTDQFFIVESSDDLTVDDIIEGLEENVIYLNSSIFVAGEDGRGITSIVKTSTAGLVDTYTITYTDATTSTFDVTNGAQGEAGATIASVEKTATVGKVDTYTITMTDGNTFDFEVTNGLDGVDLGLANIVNDLTTGGATNVLSAEMGKVIGEQLFYEENKVINTASLTRQNGSLGANGWIVYAVQRHIAIPVVAGRRYIVTVSSTETTGGFRGWLTSAYNPPYTNGAAIPYVSGKDRVWQGNGTLTITAPTGASWLICCVVDGNGKASTWGVTEIIKHSTIEDIDNNVDAVNDKTDYLFKMVAVPSTSDNYTKRSCSLGANKKWLSANNNTHIILSCNEGDIFDVEVTQSTGTGSFYGWLASYSTPSGGATTPYVSGKDRVWVNVNEGKRLVAPTGAKYLCLVTRDGDGHDDTWAITKYKINDYVNGVFKKSNFCFTPSSYIPIKESYETYMTFLQTYGQGATIYGNYFVQAFNQNYKKIRIYNLTSKQLVQEVNLPTFANTRYHNNTISFSGTKYDNGDDFPLLYMCSGYTDTDSVSTTEVYVVRIVGSAGNYTTSLVQTITIDFGIVNGWTEFVCDPINNRAWITGTGVATIICVALPSTSGSAVTINENTAIIDSFDYGIYSNRTIGTSTKSSGQGMFFYKNRIYCTHGVPTFTGEGVDALLLSVTNTLTHCIEALVPLKNFGLSAGNSDQVYEPESCFIWGDELYIAYRTFIAKLIM